MTPCMGGWCRKRVQCAHYTATNGEPVERLCAPGLDEPLRVIPIAHARISDPEKAAA
jgi:hypothetical protein